MRALYPGSFDPVTFGHLDIIKRAAQIFDEIVVGVANNTRKAPMFGTGERLEMLKASTKNIRGLKIVAFNGLVVDFAKKNNIKVVIRGLRMISDFEYELQMALTNRRLNEKIETVFLMPTEGYSFLSSTLIKEAACLGADVSSFVPQLVARQIKKKISKSF